MKKLTTEEFIEKCKLIFPQYDYSQTKYIDSRTEISVICPKHGKISQIPYRFLNKGCPKCSYENRKTRKLSQEEAINRLKRIHPNYDFSKSIYNGAQNSISFVCPVHGIQERKYEELLRYGCHECSYQNVDTEKFIAKAKLISPEYDYSLVNYCNNRTKVTIICSKHGKIEMTPSQILQGAKCKFCGYDNSRLTQEEFLKRCKDTWGDLFDFSETIYKGNDIPFFVKCNKCGRILKKDYGHFLTRKHGCLYCYRNSKLEKLKLDYNGTNYKEDYFKLIEYAKKENRDKSKGYFELHHIIPKSLGGSNDLNNVILLTAKEHYLAHYLLWKFTNTEEMTYAFWRMTFTGNKLIDQNIYEEIRTAAAKASSKKHCKKVFCVELNKVFDSAQQAAIEIFNDIKKSAYIGCVCNGKYKQTLDYHFKWA